MSLTYNQKENVSLVNLLLGWAKFVDLKLGPKVMSHLWLCIYIENTNTELCGLWVCAKLNEEFRNTNRMGWVWKDDEPDQINSSASDVSDFPNPKASRSGDRCSTRKVVKSQCRTEEVEPGKFIRKCEKTEEVLRNCVGKYVSIFIYIYI